MIHFRRQSLSIAAVIAALAVVVSAQRGKPAHSGPASDRPAATASKRTVHAVPFAPGETLTYDVSWASSLTAGGATLSVKDK